MAETRPFEEHQRQLVCLFVRWALVILAVAFVANCVWFLWDPGGTAVQNGAVAMAMATIAWASSLARRGRVQLGVRLFLGSGITFVLLVTLLLGSSSLLNGPMGLALFVVMGSFLESPRHALRWGLIAICGYVLVLTIRLGVPALNPGLSRGDLLSAYLFPVFFLAFATLLCRAAAIWLQGMLARSEAARHELAASRRSLLEAQAALEVANEQLGGELVARQQVERRLCRQLGEAALLQCISEVVAQAEDLPAALQAICGELAGHLKVPQAGFALLNADRTAAEVVAEVQPPDRPGALGEKIPVAGNPSMAYILEHRVPLAISAAQADPQLTPVHDLMRRRNVASILLVPILGSAGAAAGKEVIGTLGLDAYEEREFGQDEIDLLERVSAQVGQMLQRKRSEAALRQSEETVRALLNAAQDLALLIDAEGTILDANEAFAAYAGQPLEDLVGRPAWRLFPEPIAAQRRAYLAEALRSRRALQFEEPGARENSWYHTILSPVIDDEGRVTRLAIVVRDTTQRRQMEEALRQSEAEIRALLDAARSVVHFVDAEGRLVAANQMLSTVLGLPREAIVNRTIWDLFPVPIAAEGWAAMVEVFRSGLPVDLEVFSPEGKSWWEADFTPVIDGQGRVTRVAVVARDITQRRQMEEALRASEARYRSMFEESPTPLWEEDQRAVKEVLDRLRVDAGGSLADLETYLADHPDEAARIMRLGRIVHTNRAMLELFQADGREDRIVLGGLSQALDEASHGPRRAELLAIAQGATWFEQELRMLTLRGETRQVVMRWVVPPGHEADRAQVLNSMMDVTALKQAEAEMQRSLEAVTRGQQLLLAVSGAAQVLQRSRSPDEVYRALGEQLRVLGYEGMALSIDTDGEHLTVEQETLAAATAAAFEEVLGFPVCGYCFRLEPGGPLTLAAVEMLCGEQIAAYLASVLPEALRPRAGEILSRFWPAQEGRVILAPIRAGAEVHGLLAVGAFEIGNGDDADLSIAAERESVAALAGQAATALANARLNQEIEAWTAELERRVEEVVGRSQAAAGRSRRLLLALSQAAQAVQRGRTAEEVYRIIGEQVRRLGYQALVFAVDWGDPDRPTLSAIHHTIAPERVRQAERLCGLTAQTVRIPVIDERSRRQMLEQGECIWVERTADLMAASWPGLGRPLFEVVAAQLGVQRSIWTPLRLGRHGKAGGSGDCEQVEALFGLAGSDLTEADQPAVTLLANQAAIALENARLLREVETNRVRLQELARDVVTAQEEERRRLSRSLHDEAGQVLTALKISLDLLRQDLPARPAALQRRVADAIRVTDATMGGIRALAQDLRPPALDAVGLNHTLEGYCRDYGARIGLPILYQGTDPGDLVDSAKITLYRCLQEGLTNVAKHARARSVEVTLRSEKGMISLRVRDDGQGFVPAEGAAGNQGGLGLLGIRERLAAIGGWLEIQSTAGQGTCLTAYVPWEEAKNEP